jgi:LuxR family transcriptional regulator
MLKDATIPVLLGEMNSTSPAGFAVALHIRFTTPTFLFQNYPPGWLEEYTARGLHLNDPNVSWGFTHTGAIRWSELEKDDPAGVMARARDYGMAFGVAWALVRDESRNVAGFARAEREFTDEEIEALGQLLSRLHDETSGDRHLSSEDRLALKEMSIRLTHA